jgi:hypothetical protein
MLAAHEHRTEVTLDMLEQSITSLLRQVRADSDFLTQRRPIGLVNNPPTPGRKNSRNTFGLHE